MLMLILFQPSILKFQIANPNWRKADEIHFQIPLH